MTYRAFLLMFLLPQLLLVMGLLMTRYRTSAPAVQEDLRRGMALVTGLTVVAVVYTAPWDRWLILQGVWSYPPGSVLTTIARVPIEEYLFMISQTLLTGCWALFVMARDVPAAPLTAPWRRPAYAGLWLLAASGGLLMSFWAHTTYLGAILTWFALPLAVQAAAGADLLHAARARRLAALALTPLLWASDTVAIHNGSWRISAGRTTGVAVFGLPMEEAVFFLATNLLVVNSVALIAAPAMRERLGRWSAPCP